MEVKEVNTMTKILDDYELKSVKRPFISSKNALDFLKVIELHSELEKEKSNIYQKLDDKEKHEVFEIIRKIYNIPRHLTVKDVAEIMGITPQMVRRYCTGGSCPPNKR